MQLFMELSASSRSLSVWKCDAYVPYILTSCFGHDETMQEEIKIINVTVFVNPYAEPDEEDGEEKTKTEKTVGDEDKVSSIYHLLLKSGALLLAVYY